MKRVIKSYCKCTSAIESSDLKETVRAIANYMSNIDGIVNDDQHKVTIRKSGEGYNIYIRYRFGNFFAKSERHAERNLTILEEKGYNPEDVLTDRGKTLLQFFEDVQQDLRNIHPDVDIKISHVRDGLYGMYGMGIGADLVVNVKRVIKESVTSSKTLSPQIETEGNIKMKRFIKANTSEPFIYDGTKRPPEGVTEVIVADGVTSIGHSAFSYCRSLRNITIPNSVTSIGDSAFSWCSSLTSIKIPDSVTSIGRAAFYECNSLRSITIPEGVTSIGDDAFSDCDSLTRITIPNSVTSIGDWAFSRCSSLTSIKIPNSVTSIGDAAFQRCSSLESITIPDSVTIIGDSAFSWCSSLTNVAIPNSVTIIENYAFSYCSSLESITIPDSVTIIGEGAFYRCGNLTSITIPDSVIRIEQDAFKACNKLTSFKCSDKVKALIDAWKIKNFVDVDEDERGIIESDDDFDEYMQGFGSDVMDKITKKYPNIEIYYEQNGQGGNYTNDFFGTTPDGNSFSATISDSEVSDYDNYSDIIEYGVNQVISAIESAGDIVTI